MRRLIPFTTVLGVCTYFAWQISELLGFILDVTSFTIGIVVAAFTGFIWFLLSDWWSTATRPYRPQTVTLPTAETPNQIGCAALWARAQLFFFYSHCNHFDHFDSQVKLNLGPQTIHKRMQSISLSHYESLNNSSIPCP